MINPRIELGSQKLLSRGEFKQDQHWQVNYKYGDLSDMKWFDKNDLEQDITFFILTAKQNKNDFSPIYIFILTKLIKDKIKASKAGQPIELNDGGIAFSSVDSYCESLVSKMKSIASDDCPYSQDDKSINILHDEKSKNREAYLKIKLRPGAKEALERAGIPLRKVLHNHVEMLFETFFYLVVMRIPYLDGNIVCEANLLFRNQKEYERLVNKPGKEIYFIAQVNDRLIWVPYETVRDGYQTQNRLNEHVIYNLKFDARYFLSTSNDLQERQEFLAKYRTREDYNRFLNAFPNLDIQNPPKLIAAPKYPVVDLSLDQKKLPLSGFLPESKDVKDFVKPKSENDSQQNKRKPHRKKSSNPEQKAAEQKRIAELNRQRTLSKAYKKQVYLKLSDKDANIQEDSPIDKKSEINVTPPQHTSKMFPLPQVVATQTFLNVVLEQSQEEGIPDREVHATNVSPHLQRPVVPVVEHKQIKASLANQSLFSKESKIHPRETSAISSNYPLKELACDYLNKILNDNLNFQLDNSQKFLIVNSISHIQANVLGLKGIIIYPQEGSNSVMISLNQVLDKRNEAAELQPGAVEIEVQKEEIALQPGM